MAKATYFKFSVHICRVDQNKNASKQFGKSIRRRSQGVSKTFRALIYKAHRAVGHLCVSTAFLLFSLFIFNGPPENQLSRNGSARFHLIFRMVGVWVQMINLTFVLWSLSWRCCGNQFWCRIGEVGLTYLHSSHCNADVKRLNGNNPSTFCELPSSNSGVYETRMCTAGVDQ